MYLLDTNICIELLAGNSRVIGRLDGLGPVRVYSSSITLGELAYGAARSSFPTKELVRVKQFVRHVSVLPVDMGAAYQYGILKSQLAAQGLLLEDNDLFIASIALTRRLTLVTHDYAFRRVAGLVLEDWLG